MLNVGEEAGNRKWENRLSWGQLNYLKSSLFSEMKQPCYGRVGYQMLAASLCLPESTYYHQTPPDHHERPPQLDPC